MAVACVKKQRHNNTLVFLCLCTYDLRDSHPGPSLDGCPAGASHDAFQIRVPTQSFYLREFGIAPSVPSEDGLS